MLWGERERTLRKPLVVSALGRRQLVVATLVCSFICLGAGLNTAGAGAAKTVGFVLSEHDSYACLGPCATAADFVVNGTARSPALGTLTVLGIGHVDGYADAQRCSTASERWGFTGSNGKDSLEATTKGDKICFNKDYSAAVETAKFTITGGTGKYEGASGSGHFKFSVLSSPQKGSGTITGSLQVP